VVLMTWNLGRRTHSDHVRIIGEARADVVALQEVSPVRGTSIVQELAGLGLNHVHAGAVTGQGFPFSMMIASRWAITPRTPHGVNVPRPDRVQVVTIHTPHGDVELVHAHVPAATSSGVATKVATFDGLARYLNETTGIARILCGDFNTPKLETDGRIQYWGDARQQRAERSVIEGGEASGLRDAYRALHPSSTAGSWRASKSVARRYDHVFASPHFEPITAIYGDLDALADTGVSDHAPLTVDLRLGRAVPVRIPSTVPKAVASPPPPAISPPANPRPTPTSVERQPMQHPVDDSEARAFLDSLTYRRDDRNPPDDARRQQFKIQWTRAARGESMSEKTLGAKLTWANLGYRAGRQFGPASDAKIDAMFDRFATVYRRDAKAAND